MRWDQRYDGKVQDVPSENLTLTLNVIGAISGFQVMMFTALYYIFKGSLLYWEKKKSKRQG